MDINTIIDELKVYCYQDNSLINIEKELIDNYQEEFLNGFIGILLNKYTKSEGFEVYLSIKSKKKIACPLLYKHFNNENSAREYFQNIKKLIILSNEEKIINHCKIRN